MSRETFLPLSKKLSFAFVFLAAVNASVKAQTTLVAGDIAFTGYASAGATTDVFSFVLLKNVTAGTVINFTDNAWLDAGLFRTGEQTVTWTSSTAIIAGREITISGPGAGTATAVFSGNGTSAGTCTGTMPSLSTSGDQVLAYQGTAASPTFISAIHMNVYSVANFDPINTTAAQWDFGNSNNTSASVLPPGLTTGTTAIWVGVFNTAASEFDNAIFNCTGTLNTAAQVRNAVNNYTPSTNWNTTNGAPAVNPPSGCTFLGVIPLPVTIISFTGKLNPDKTATLQWKVTEQLNMQQYTLEESHDAIVFKTLGVVPAGNTASDTYHYTDMLLSAGDNYYRLKTTELSGKISYSNIIDVNLKAGIKTSIYPNPVSGIITIQQFTKQNGDTY